MVEITKRRTKGIGLNAALRKVRNKKTSAFAVSFTALLILVLIGVYCLSWFAVVVISTKGKYESFELGGDHHRLRIMQQQQRRQQHRENENKQQYNIMQHAKFISMQLDQLCNSIPLSSGLSLTRQPEKGGERRQANQNQQHQQFSSKGEDYNKIVTMESQFLFAVRKECIPGRDDSSGEINPTTHRQRECLRYVPTISQNKNDNSHKSEVDMKSPKPRIGLMFPPGFIGQSFAQWIANALEQSSSSANTSSSLHPKTNLTVDLRILPTSHVPVYGYGKSHGYTKLIRFVTLPLPLAAYDASLRGILSSAAISSSSSSSSSSVLDSCYLREALKRMNSETANDISSPISAATMGSMLRLILRWHCRLSHVSAHTAMLTLSLGDVLKDPSTALTRVLSFIWREDWEWEDHGNGNHRRDSPKSSVGNSSSSSSSSSSSIGWKAEANDLIVNHVENFQSFLDVSSFILNETISLVNRNDNEHTTLQQSIQEAFASEMERSAGMTAWPCPSFWEGIEVENVDNKPGSTILNKAHGDDDNSQIVHVLRQIAEDMVPNCSDDDPFVRCTVNKDRCEVKRRVKCN